MGLHPERPAARGARVRARAGGAGLGAPNGVAARTRPAPRSRTARHRRGGMARGHAGLPVPLGCSAPRCGSRRPIRRPRRRGHRPGRARAWTRSRPWRRAHADRTRGDTDARDAPAPAAAHGTAPSRHAGHGIASSDRVRPHPTSTPSNAPARRVARCRPAPTSRTTGRTSAERRKCPRRGGDRAPDMPGRDMPGRRGPAGGGPGCPRGSRQPVQPFTTGWFACTQAAAVLAGSVPAC